MGALSGRWPLPLRVLVGKLGFLLLSIGGEGTDGSRQEHV